ncbi:MAG: DNA translocase FtsK [Ignavibacteria bacterium]|nr:DNA translocase FtsK [Ignavibacteria bacterium]
MDIIGILMIVFAVFVFLALLSHSSADESSADLGLGDLVRLFGGDQDIQARADMTHNWLGLFGALIAKFFINITIGYFSIAFPILLGLWGWFILRKKDLRAPAYYTNYAVILVFLGATFFGLLRLVSWMPEISPSWAGNIGDFTAGLIARLIGTTGGIIAIVTTIIVLAIVVVDYDIHKTLERVRHLGGAFLSTFRRDESMLAAAGEHGATVRIDVDSVPALPDPVPLPSVKVSARKKADAPAPDPVPSEPPAPPKRIPVSIARTDDGLLLRPAGDLKVRADEESQPVPPEGGMRSNGVIAKENIAELRGIYADENEEASHHEAVSKSRDTAQQRTADAGPQDAEDVMKTPEHQGKGADATVVDPAGVMINEHEKRAVQQAIAKKVAFADASVNSEETNKELAGEKLGGYKFPTPEILDEQVRFRGVTDEELKLKAELVVEKLAVFGIGIRDIQVIPGPVVTQFELVPDSSVKISKIVSLADDLALALAARGIRIIAPIPGKSAVGVEIPNNAPEMVNFRSVVSSSQFQKAKLHLPLGLGKAINGDVFCDDLARMPHLLIAGATGSGKSVGINVMICSLLYKLHPSEVKFVMIDPKKIELQQYRGLSQHFLATSPDIDEEIITDPANAVIVLKSLELEMDMRYTKLAKAGVRHVNDYNQKVRAGLLKDTDTLSHYKLPYIVVIIDELADLMITAAREVEEPIARLAQLARAVGMHLIVATQRPSVDVLTGVIKANFSARIAYQVASRIDSRTILDTQGADQLLGNGDMLYQPSGQPKPVRIQNAFLATAEVERIVDFIDMQKGYLRPYHLPSVKAGKRGQSREDSIDTDDLLHEAARLIVRYQQGSVSLLQRRLKIGYSRAARIVDQLESAGVVGPADGSKARDVLVEDEQVLDEILLHY